MNRVAGKVAVVTGAARGMGRSHCLRLAEEGADIIAVDICGPVGAALTYAPSSTDELAETAASVESLGVSALTCVADVRDLGQLEAAVAAGLARFGRIDIVCANAGIAHESPAATMTEADWQRMIDINLSGVWRTVRACVPSMIERGEGGSIVITGSFAGMRGIPNVSHYCAAKHGLVGFMRALAQEVGPSGIRVNLVAPGAVPTGMMPGIDIPEVRELLMSMNMLPVPSVAPLDISNAVLWLASDESRYITAVELPVDAGMTQKAVTADPRPPQ